MLPGPPDGRTPHTLPSAPGTGGNRISATRAQAGSRSHATPIVHRFSAFSLRPPILRSWIFGEGPEKIRARCGEDLGKVRCSFGEGVKKVGGPSSTPGGYPGQIISLRPGFLRSGCASAGLWGGPGGLAVPGKHSRMRVNLPSKENPLACVGQSRPGKTRPHRQESEEKIGGVADNLLINSMLLQI